jgi:hypothetical protein
MGIFTGVGFEVRNILLSYFFLVFVTVLMTSSVVLDPMFFRGTNERHID